MKLNIDRIIVYDIRFTEEEKHNLCTELMELPDSDVFPTLNCLKDVISDVRPCFMS